MSTTTALLNLLPTTQGRGNRRSITLLAIFGVVSALTPVHTQAQPSIVWVSFHPGDDTPSANAAGAGFTRAPDAEYTDLLEGAGAQVTRYVSTATPDPILLNAADLVIISRSINSGNYMNAAATAWNTITAPMMIMSGYVLRNSRLGFTTGETIPDTAGTIRLTLNDSFHEIFQGTSIDFDLTMINPYAHLVQHNGTTQRGISVNNNPLSGNGVVLASVGRGDPTFGGMIIAEWQAGDSITHVAGTDILGGHRLVFLSGSREQGITGEGAGIYDLDEDGGLLFLKAVNYMARSNLAPPPTIENISPANGAALADAGDGLSFTVTSSVDLPTSGITVLVNNVDVSASLQFGGTPTARDVAYNGLEPGKLYTVDISVTGPSGSRGAAVVFDTFSEASNLFIEAEDFNFNGGQFFDNVILCNDVGAATDGCYFGRVSQPGVDALDSLGFADNTSDDTVVYRFLDQVDTPITADGLRAKYVNAPPGVDGPIRDYDVGTLATNDWQNYTRTVTEDIYVAYLRASSTVDQEIQLGLVKSSPGQANQVVDLVGTFKLKGGAGYQTVPLTTAGSGALKSFLVGGATTFRLTTLRGVGNLSLNYFLLAPSDQSAIPTTVAVLSPADGARFYQSRPVMFRASASGPDGTAGTVTQVEYFVDRGSGPSSAGVATSPPYEITTSSLAPGTYAVRATATDNEGGTGTSAAISLEIRPVIPGNLGNIAWVSFHAGDDMPSAAASTAGFTQAPDLGYTELLWANGYNVTRFVTTAAPDPAAFDQSDLIIVSRSVPSGNYQNAGATAWNTLAKPMMIMSGYTLRQSRMGFTTGETIPDIAGTVRLTAANPSHPIFSGVSLDINNTMEEPFAHIVSVNGITQRGISVNTSPLAGNGVSLASIGTPGDPANGGMVIGEWQAGATMGDATMDILAGPRLVFLSGTREAAGVSAETAGIYDLDPEGERLFINAVRYMLPAPPSFERVSINLDGSITITWTGGGTLQEATSLASPNWQPVAGAVSPHTVQTPTGNAFYRVVR